MAIGEQTAAGALFDDQLPWDENREMCNSARLRALIQQGIVPSSVEKSKRQLQQRAEAQFGAFYNVICGTGFFSYIAHTDEFWSVCLVVWHFAPFWHLVPLCNSTDFAVWWPSTMFIAMFSRQFVPPNLPWAPELPNKDWPTIGSTEGRSRAEEGPDEGIS
jgi:hypothetical protein